MACTRGAQTRDLRIPEGCDPPVLPRALSGWRVDQVFCSPKMN